MGSARRKAPQRDAEIIPGADFKNSFALQPFRIQAAICEIIVEDPVDVLDAALNGPPPMGGAHL